MIPLPEGSGISKPNGNATQKNPAGVHEETGGAVTAADKTSTPATRRGNSPGGPPGFGCGGSRLVVRLPFVTHRMRGGGGQATPLLSKIAVRNGDEHVGIWEFVRVMLWTASIFLQVMTPMHSSCDFIFVVFFPPVASGIL